MRNLPRSAIALATLSFALLIAGCGSSDDADDPSEVTPSTTTTSGFKQAKWGSNVTITYGDGYIEYKSDGIPDHERPSEYALPNEGVMIPDANSAYAAPDPTKAQSYDFKIPTTPTIAAEPTSTSLGTIGVMISGAALYNPYEGDGTTIAMAGNFSVKDADGNDVWFLDDCNGHPNPGGAYHYHGLPECITATVDTDTGPSHIIGIAFDGYPIYGDKDMNGDQITAEQLDECNGITSATPEFPDGVYHYVLLDVPDSTSSIRCFKGESSISGMDGMGPPPGGGPPMGGR